MSLPKRKTRYTLITDAAIKRCLHLFATINLDPGTTRTEKMEIFTELRRELGGLKGNYER